MLALEFGDGFEVAQGFGFDGLGFAFVVEDSFEFLFFAEQCTKGLGVVQGEGALLNSGVALQRGGLAGGRIGYFGERELVTIQLRDFGDEIEGMDRLRWWMD